MGVGVYAEIPDYRAACPICGGRNCAVRHGLYHRRVFALDGRIYDRFPVPRFRCRRRGLDGAPPRRLAVTFSVLPAQLIPRRQPSLPLVLWLLDRWLAAGNSIRQTQDDLASRFAHQPWPWLPEPGLLYRLRRLFAVARQRLGPQLAARREGTAHPTECARALSLVEQLVAEARPTEVVLAFHHRCFPKLVFAPRRRASLADRRQRPEAPSDGACSVPD